MSGSKLRLVPVTEKGLMIRESVMDLGICRLFRAKVAKRVSSGGLD